MGVGHRHIQRFGAKAEEGAARLRSELAGGLGITVPPTASFSALGADWVAESGKAPGTIRQYRSNFNCWVKDVCGAVPTRELTLAHWSAIFDRMVRDGASEETIRAVERTLNAFTAWGSPRGWFGTVAPWQCDASQRRGVAKNAQRRASVQQATSRLTASVTQAAQRHREDAKGTLTEDKRLERRREDARQLRAVCSRRDRTGDGGFYLSVVPPTDEIERLAAACENAYPGFGARAVRLSYGTGVRVCELLALREENIDLATGEVRVEAQLDRSRPWPAVTLPKGGKRRPALAWACFQDDLEHAVKAAQDGWLFPPDRAQAWWADAFGRRVNDVIDEIAWEWPWHWLRHAYGSVSLAPRESGGFGLELASVSRWMGHHDPAVTLRYYIQPHSDDMARARESTRQRPGH